MTAERSPCTPACQRKRTVLPRSDPTKRNHGCDRIRAMPPIPRPSSVSVERGGELVSRRRGVQPADVVTAVRELQGGRDITVSIEPDGIEERLIVALDRTCGFLGLERPDGIFQFCPAVSATNSREFLIGGQPTEIEARYVVDVVAVSDVIAEWLSFGETSSLGSWQRQ